MALPSITELEAAALVSWPAIEEERDGAWVVRFSKGYTNRANCVQSLDAADDADAPARLARIAGEFRRRGLPPIFRISPLAGRGTVAAIDALGWNTFGDSLVMAMDLPRRVRPVAAHTRYFEPADPQWWQTQAHMSDRVGRDSLGEIVANITAPARGVMLYDDDRQPVAACLMVNVGGIAMVHNVIVALNARGQGLGRAVMHAGLNWAIQSGAPHVALQVAADSERALPLYRSLGFEEIYGYHYRQAAQ